MLSKCVSKSLFPHVTWMIVQKIPKGNSDVLLNFIFYYKNESKPKGCCACKGSLWNSSDEALPRETSTRENKGLDAIILSCKMSCLFHMMQKLRKRFYSLALLTISLILKPCNKGKVSYWGDNFSQCLCWGIEMKKKRDVWKCIKWDV